MQCLEHARTRKHGKWLWVASTSDKYPFENFITNQLFLLTAARHRNNTGQDLFNLAQNSKAWSQSCKDHARTVNDQMCISLVKSSTTFPMLYQLPVFRLVLYK